MLELYLQVIITIEFIEKDKLREDLFYRLSVAPIEVPPLNKRDEDITDLIIHF